MVRRRTISLQLFPNAKVIPKRLEFHLWQYRMGAEMFIAVTGILLALAAILWIVRSRRRSIVGIKQQRKHFQSLAQDLNLKFVSDEYFVELEGLWNGLDVIILPHHFEGPGSVTLIYMRTPAPVVDRNWIEPNLSMGRAFVEWKRNSSYGYEISGSILPAGKILEQINLAPFPYVAVTLPSRFSYSPLLLRSVSTWKNFVVLIALDEGRKPSAAKISEALRAAERIAGVC
jgi:hypothetical protein